jgi:hypothetical protein
MMTSSFTYMKISMPKITTSIQEWCGQVFAQLENRDAFEIQLHSYLKVKGNKNDTSKGAS